MKAKIEVEAKPFSLPNFILVVSKRTDFVVNKALPIKDADPQLLSDMCDEFRKNIFEKAGKGDPKQGEER